MKDSRQKTHEAVASATEPKGEALTSDDRGSGTFIANYSPESSTGTKYLMEAVCSKENLNDAWKRVKAKKGSPGIDGMRVEELSAYLRNNGTKIKEQLLSGTYKPQPVLRVEIPKADGGKRKLGIPTVVDRFIQQALLQVLSPLYEPTFSEHSYGFRPKRSAHQALFQAQEYIKEGYGYVVDIDLEKFFDRVHHDRLMHTIARRVEDKRVLKIIRGYLNAGVMEDGLVKPTEEGTPQGGNLSPLLSNIVLDELDKELEARGHRFVRYADDCNIYVRTPRAGERVMKSVTQFITKRLRLKVNETKSAVDRPSKRKFLGYSFTIGIRAKRRIAPKSIQRFKDRIREITRRSRGVSVQNLMTDLMVYVRGWMGYYRYCQTLSILKSLDSWIRRRIRCYIWKQWKTYGTRVKMLVHYGIQYWPAHYIARRRGLWAASKSRGMRTAISNEYIASCGFLSLETLVSV